MDLHCDVQSENLLSCHRFLALVAVLDQAEKPSHSGFGHDGGRSPPHMQCHNTIELLGCTPHASGHILEPLVNYLICFVVAQALLLCRSKLVRGCKNKLRKSKDCARDMLLWWRANKYLVTPFPLFSIILVCVCWLVFLSTPGTLFCG